MTRVRRGVVSAFVVILQFSYSISMAETVVLRSGREVEIIDGALPPKAAETVLREASDWLKKGRLDHSREYWKLLIEKAKGVPAARAKAAEERVRNAEYESFIILRNGKTFTGKVTANLRHDLLGLEGKEAIPIWQVEEIAAEYHPGLSQVSKTYYPLTLLEIKLREHKLQTARINREIEFMVETAQGSVQRAILGKSYEILRPENLSAQIEAATKDRIIKVAIYPAIRMPE